jgi:hypothetical protein
MVAITCPNCDVELNVPLQRIGKVGKCPSCHEPFTPEMPPPPQTLGDVVAPAKTAALIVGKKTLQASGFVARTTGAMAVGFGRLTANYLERRADRKHALAIRKLEYAEAARFQAMQPRPCPMCGETIQPDAKKCKHCGEYLDPAFRPVVQPLVAPVPQHAPQPQIVIHNVANANATAVVGGRVKRWSRLAAFLLSIVPGLGHLYKGSLIGGLFWFVLVGVGYIIPPIGLGLHLLCALSAASGDPYR